ncbi:hypothetical protein ACL2XP_15925 [Sodalis sp. RH21]
MRVARAGQIDHATTPRQHAMRQKTMQDKCHAGRAPMVRRASPAAPRLR